MIPKRIFYVWGYNEPKSTLANICIENWRMNLPEYEIIEINEKTPEWFDFEHEYNTNLWFKTVYDLKMWAYVSDYIRIKTLYDHGGIYLDTDVTIYKSFSPFLDKKMFAGNVYNNIPELAVFGAEKNHPILAGLIKFYQKEIWESPLYVITQIFRKILNENYNISLSTKKIEEADLIAIYPPEYFHPIPYGENFLPEMVTEKTYTVHWANFSWGNKKTLYFLSNKHRIPLKVLLKQLEFIEKNDKDIQRKMRLNSLISVIMPVKNGMNYLKEALNGIKKQNMNLEVVLIDDCSDDNTAEFAESMGCRVIRHEKTKGQIAGKNTGLKEAKGEYIIFHDHDDILTPNALKTMYAEFEKDKALEVVITKIKDFLSPDSEPQPIKPEAYYGALGGSMLIKKSVFDKIGYFDENLTAGEVISLTSKFEEYNIKTKKIDFVSSNRRIHNTNYGKTNKKQEFKDYASILRAKLIKK